jgi:predicted ATP-grasp superfamily ATP-dependent carboligase
MQKAIVLDGQLKSALCVVRSLGRAGVALSVGAERTTAMAKFSKYAQGRFVYASPYLAPDRFLADVKKEAQRLGDKPVVYAFSDATALLLARHKQDLSECMTLVLAEEAAVETVFDKARTYQLAKQLAVPIIPTYVPNDEGEVKRVAASLTYPAVIKTRHSVAWREGKGVFGTASFVQSGEELEEKFSVLQAATGEAPLVQQFIKGEEYGVECLCDKGVLCAVVVHKRLRSLSPTGGASVLKQTVGENDLSNKMRQYTEKLLAELAWTGVAMVEFKVDATDGEPKLMEINGRFWGSLPLAVFANVDFPYLYYQLAAGKTPSELVVAWPGVVSDHLLGSLRWLGRVCFARDPLRSTLYPPRLRALQEVALPPFGTRDDVLSLADPLPSFMEYVDVINSFMVKQRT